MNRRFLTLYLMLALAIFGVTGTARATMWGAVDAACPICNTVNKFATVLSSGSYVYDDPSKYQYVFWPYTDSFNLFSCKRCRYTVFAADFGTLPPVKRDVILANLRRVPVTSRPDDYSKMPMSARLALAEQSYAALDKDAYFWCHFYRVMGFHLAAENQPAAAARARKKALEWAQRIVALNDNNFRVKEALFIAGAMRRELGERQAAAVEFRQAMAVKIGETDIPTDYLDTLLRQSLFSLEHPDVPRDKIEAESQFAYFQQQVKDHPEVPENHFNLAGLLLSHGKREEALAAYREAIRLRPQHEEPRKALVHLLERLGDKANREGQHEQALAYLREATTLDTNKFTKAVTLNNLANILQKLDRIAEAISAYQEATHLDPKRLEIRVNLGSVLADAKRYAEALIEYGEVLRRRPRYALAHFNLGNIYLDMKQLDKAITSYREAIRLESDYAEARVNLAVVLNHRKRYAEAAHELREALIKNPEMRESYKAYSNLADALRGLKRYDEAERAFRAAISIQPDDDSAYYNLACLYAIRGRRQEALTTLRQALDLDPKYKELARKDEDFKSLQNDKEFRHLIGL